VEKGKVLFILCIFYTGIVAKSSSMGFLLIDPSPNSVALAYGGINEVHNNPACMSFKQDKEISFSHIEWFTDVRIEHIGGIFRTNRFGIGLDITYLHTADIEGYDTSGDSTAPFSAYDVAGALSFSYFISSISMGVSLKLIQEKLADVTANGVAADIGIMIKDIFPGCNCGVSVLNLGTGITYELEKEDFPLAVKVLIDYAIPVYACNIYLNTGWEIDGIIISGIGVEGEYFDMFQLRLGYSYSISKEEELAQEGFSAGFGIRFREKYSFDYAVIPFSEFNMLHWAGLSIEF